MTMHTLRHSFGTDLRYVQEFLGHAKPETSMIYTHVTRKDLKRIRSPLDNIAPDGEVPPAATPPSDTRTRNSPRPPLWQ